MHVGIANPRWWGKRSRHSRRMRNPQFYVSGKSPWYHGFNDLVRQGARTAKPWYWPGSVRLLHYQHRNGCNSSPPSAAYMGQLIGSVLVQIMACRLFSAKPLPAPMLVYCLLDPQEQNSVEFESKHKIINSWKCIWKKCRLRNGRPFCPEGGQFNTELERCIYAV